MGATAEWYWLGLGAIALTVYFWWSAATEMGTKPLKIGKIKGMFPWKK
ncbi:MAG: hypothetical protein ACFCBU_08535 [Cyanophyceae cyanobacterium]